jgi:hypothetical protein
MVMPADYLHRTGYCLPEKGRYHKHYDPPIAISSDEAWRRFGEWQGRDIGAIFYGGAGTSIYTMGRIESARNGRLALKGEAVRAIFNLIGASFAHGPVQTWPRWPSPPIIEVMAIQVQLANGDWLALADGLRPELIPPRALPE